MQMGDRAPEPADKLDGAYQHNVSLLTLVGLVIILGFENMLKKIGIRRRP